MKVHHTLICFFLTALQETDLINAETFIRTEPEGGNMTVACNFKLPGGKKIFCKNECKEDKDILIKTVKDRAQSGRYSIEYKEGTLLVSSTLLYVTITQLTKSDSGRYWCGLERTGFLDGYDEIDLRVTDAPTTSIPDCTLPPFSTSLPSASTPTLIQTTQSLTSSSSSSPETSKQPETSSAGSGFFLVLVTCVPVVVVVVLLVVVLLLLYKKRIKDSHGSDMRGNSEHTEMEFVVYENCTPASTHQDPIYQGINPASRDHDQTYSTLTHMQHK
ncbi:CMRF35-like molecule 5 isoform X20 [Lates calcarifer]|uniref:CMRF35-like molecule 5 isoform X20 n=1 Tax=Lates calcarifer TaxID=8187 RepID=A0AAJ7LED7_LATCA|nr:CMRF35-like molecule 5 isoform X20 [Lates calcarifer]